MELYEALASWAAGDLSLLVLFLWAFAEALLFPILPDFLLIPLAVVQPSRFWLFALWAAAGALLGGSIAYAAGVLRPDSTAKLWEHLPLVTPSIHAPPM